MPDPTPIDRVRDRYPETPDEDASALQEHAEHLVSLRRSVRTSQLQWVEPAMTFDPRGGAR